MNAVKTDERPVMKIRSSEVVEVEIAINGKKAGPTLQSEAGQSFSSLELSLSKNPQWQGKIESLRFDFAGKAGAFIEIDSISVERTAAE